MGTDGVTIGDAVWLGMLLGIPDAVAALVVVSVRIVVEVAVTRAATLVSTVDMVDVTEGSDPNVGITTSLVEEGRLNTTTAKIVTSAQPNATRRRKSLFLKVCPSGLIQMTSLNGAKPVYYATSCKVVNFSFQVAHESP